MEVKTLTTSFLNATPITDEEGMFAHLVSNRLVPTPEVPSTMIAQIVDICLKAVSLARQGWLEEVIELPEGITHNNSNVAQVHEIIEAFDLEDWLF